MNIPVGGTSLPLEIKTDTAPDSELIIQVSVVDVTAGISSGVTVSESSYTFSYGDNSVYYKLTIDDSVEVGASFKLNYTIYGQNAESYTLKLPDNDDMIKVSVSEQHEAPSFSHSAIVVDRTYVNITVYSYDIGTIF